MEDGQKTDFNFCIPSLVINSLQTTKESIKKTSGHDQGAILKPEAVLR